MATPTRNDYLEMTHEALADLADEYFNSILRAQEAAEDRDRRLVSSYTLIREAVALLAADEFASKKAVLEKLRACGCINA